MRLGVRPPADEPYLGLTFGEKTQIKEVDADSPAAKAGFKEKDVITRFDGAKVDTLDELKAQLREKKPGDEVMLEVRRGDKETLTLKVVLGKKG